MLYSHATLTGPVCKWFYVTIQFEVIIIGQLNMTFQLGYGEFRIKKYSFVNIFNLINPATLKKNFMTFKGQILLSFSKQLDQIARLSARSDQLEGEMKLSEDRYQTLAGQLEQETIASRDREKKIQQLQEEVKLLPMLLRSHKNNCRA